MVLYYTKFIQIYSTLKKHYSVIMQLTYIKKQKQETDKKKIKRSIILY